MFGRTLTFSYFIHPWWAVSQDAPVPLAKGRPEDSTGSENLCLKFEYWSEWQEARKSYSWSVLLAHLKNLPMGRHFFPEALLCLVLIYLFIKYYLVPLMYQVLFYNELNHKSTNIFYKGPNNKYFRLCGAASYLSQPLNSADAAQISHRQYGNKWAINGHGCVLIKLYLLKQVATQIWLTGKVTVLPELGLKGGKEYSWISKHIK